jgi:hypothetical protein
MNRTKHDRYLQQTMHGYNVVTMQPHSKIPPPPPQTRPAPTLWDKFEAEASRVASAPLPLPLHRCGPDGFSEGPAMPTGTHGSGAHGSVERYTGSPRRHPRPLEVTEKIGSILPDAHRSRARSPTRERGVAPAPAHAQPTAHEAGAPHAHAARTDSVVRAASARGGQTQTQTQAVPALPVRSASHASSRAEPKRRAPMGASNLRSQTAPDALACSNAPPVPTLRQPGGSDGGGTIMAASVKAGRQWSGADLQPARIREAAYEPFPAAH